MSDNQLALADGLQSRSDGGMMKARGGSQFISSAGSEAKMAGASGEQVIVIGGGIIGACVAYALTEAGARVTVMVAGTPGRGTSAASLAWVNAASKTPQ